MPENQISLKYRYIENTQTLPILQIPNEYRKVFKDSECTDLLEIHLISGTVFGLMYIEHITIGGLILSENANNRIYGLLIERQQSS